MKRLIFLMLALLVAGSASAATKVQVMTDGVIDVDRLPTISFFQENDPASPELGQIWWNNATNQLKVAGALGVYAFNATSLVAWDTTPEAFSFTDVENATTSTVYISAPITVSGINWPAAISVSGDTSAKYSVNNATATATAGTVASGDEVRAVVTSSASDGTAVNATVTIGGVSDAYVVTTAAASNSTYLIDEDFEGTGTPSGWTTAGTINFDATSDPLNGVQSMTVAANGGTSGSAIVSFSNSTEVFFHYMMQTTFSDAGMDYVFVKSGANEVLKLNFRTGQNIVATYPGGTAATPMTLTGSTVYHFWIWLDAENGDGAVYIGTDTTRPAAPSLSWVNGSGAYGSADSLWFRSSAWYGIVSKVDDVKISTTDFSSVE